MIKRVIFFSTFPFNQRDFKRFGIKILENNGFDVEVWDLAQVASPRLFRNYVPPDNIVERQGLRRFSTVHEAVEAIASLSDEDFVVYGGGSYLMRDLPILQALAKVPTEYAVITANAFPTGPLDIDGKKASHYHTVTNRIKNITTKKLAKYIENMMLTMIPHPLLGLKPAAIKLAGGASSHNPPHPLTTASETETYWIHAPDYDNYLDVKENGQEAVNNYIVFLDSYVPFHPDIHSSNVVAQQPFSPEEYYSVLCRFFDSVEAEMRCSVIIAAHPRAQYDKLPDYFNGRKVVRGKTCELVKGCRFSITQQSSSVNYAVLFQKPVLFVTWDSFNLVPFLARPLNILASWLNKTPINLSYVINIDWSKELKVDEEAYSNYSYHYIKIPGTPQLPLWQVVADHLKSRGK